MAKILFKANFNYSRLIKLKRIISVSRRTDIPAFYGDWFLNRINEGFVGYLNPFSNDKYRVSLKKEDVECFVFWSKNFIPFIDKLKIINNLGHNFYFNYTINGYSDIIEKYALDTNKLIDNLILLSKTYSKDYINWRYDPIIISDKTNFQFHLKNFQIIAKRLKNHVERCIISFVYLYEKVKKNILKVEKEHNILIQNPEFDFKIKLANELAEIATSYGIKMYSCCGDYLTGQKIKKAHCVDWELIKKLFYNKGTEIYYKTKPTRKECGCTESTDIGAYNTCAHGCIYCYANIDKEDAYNKHKDHDKNSIFLGYSERESKIWLSSIKDR